MGRSEAVRGGSVPYGRPQSLEMAPSPQSFSITSAPRPAASPASPTSPAPYSSRLSWTVFLPVAMCILVRFCRGRGGFYSSPFFLFFLSLDLFLFIPGIPVPGLYRVGGIYLVVG